MTRGTALVLILGLGMLGGRLYMSFGDEYNEITTSNRSENVWLLWIPYGGKHNLGSRSSGAFLLNPKQQLRVGETERSVMGVCASITRATGVEFTFSEEAATYQYAPVFTAGSEPTIAEALGKLVTALTELVRESPILPQLSNQHTYNNKSIVLRFALRSTDASQKGRMEKPIIQFSYAGFSIEEKLRQLAKQFDITETNLPTSQIVQRFMEKEGYKVESCVVDDKLGGVWMMMPVGDAETFQAYGLRVL